MPVILSRKLSRAALAMFITVSASGGALMATSIQPALALCKYGGPHCVTRHVGSPMVAVDNGIRIPESGWSDPDCRYYGNCKTGRRVQHEEKRGPFGKEPLMGSTQRR